MPKVKVLEAGYVVQELTVEEALKLIDQKLDEGQSVIIDGVYIADPRHAKNLKELLSNSKEGISFFPMIGGGEAQLFKP